MYKAQENIIKLRSLIWDEIKYFFHTLLKNVAKIIARGHIGIRG